MIKMKGKRNGDGFCKLLGERSNGSSFLHFRTTGHDKGKIKMSDGENIFEDVAKLKKDVAFIADSLQLDLPKQKNYHDCIIHTIEMSGDEEGNLFLNMRNYFKEMKKIQVKFCPVCGHEGNDPPCFKLATFPRCGDEPRGY